MKTQIAELNLAHSAFAKAFYQLLNGLLSKHGDELAKALCHRRGNDVGKFCATVAELANEPFSENSEWQRVENNFHSVSTNIVFGNGHGGYERVHVCLEMHLLGDDEEAESNRAEWARKCIEHYHQQLKQDARRLCEQRQAVNRSIKALPVELQGIALGKKVRRS